MSEHNWAHLYERAKERMEALSSEERERCHKCFLGIEKRVRENKRSLPNQWHRPVKDGKKLLGFFVGTGVVVRSFLSAEMTPKGQLL